MDNWGGKKHHHEEGELWLVAYADMVTLLMGFFVILYSFSSIDEEKFSKVSKDVADALGDQSKDDASAKENLLSDDQRRLKYLAILVTMMNMGDMDTVIEKVRRKEGTAELAGTARAILREEPTSDPAQIMEVVLPAEALFSSGNATIKPTVKRTLATVADKIRSVEDLVKIEVTGHSDTTTFRSLGGQFPDNWSLSSARAAAVASALISLGVDQKKISATGKADTEPLFPERSASGQILQDNMARNRRVHITLRVRNDTP